MLCVIFLGNCLAVKKLKFAHFDLTLTEPVIGKVEFILFILVLLGICLLGLTLFTVANFVSISCIPIIVFKSNLCYDDRRVILDQIFWIIPLTFLFCSFVCKFWFYSSLLFVGRKIMFWRKTKFSQNIISTHFKILWQNFTLRWGKREIFRVFIERK